MINHCKHSTQKESYEQLSRRLPVSKCEFKKKYKVTLQTVNIDGHHHDHVASCRKIQLKKTARRYWKQKFQLTCLIFCSLGLQFNFFNIM